MRILNTELVSQKLQISKELANAFITSASFLKEGEDFVSENGILQILTPRTLISLASIANYEHYSDIADLIIDQVMEDNTVKYHNLLQKYIEAFPEYLASQSAEDKTESRVQAASTPIKEQAVNKVQETKAAIVKENKEEPLVQTNTDPVSSRVKLVAKPKPVKKTDKKSVKAKNTVKQKPVKEKVVMTQLPAMRLTGRKTHVGITLEMKSGQKATCVQYVSSMETTIRYEDGLIRTNIQFAQFNNREVAHQMTEFDKKNFIKALFGYSFKEKCYIDDDGKCYDDMRGLCRAHDISYDAVRWVIQKYRITFSEYLEYQNAGKNMTVPEYFKLKAGEAEKTADTVQAADKTDVTEKTEDTKQMPAEETAVAIVNETSSKVSKKFVDKLTKLFSADSAEAPALTDEEKAWAYRMLELMETDKCKSYSKLRKRIYTRMRNVYSVVLEQSAKEYNRDHNIPYGDHISYFRVITQTPQLASIFGSILEDVASGTLELTD